MKIVIVDDDILVSSALKTILEAGGEVEVTGTGQDGKMRPVYDELLPDVSDGHPYEGHERSGRCRADLKMHTDAKYL